MTYKLIDIENIKDQVCNREELGNLFRYKATGNLLHLESRIGETLKFKELKYSYQASRFKETLLPY